MRIYRRITMPREMLSRYCNIVFLNPLHHSRSQTGNHLRIRREGPQTNNGILRIIICIKYWGKVDIQT